MSTTINLSLTDELKKFVQQNSGNGTVYSTPSDYVRDLIRHEMESLEAAEVRAKIVGGYHDAINGKMTQFSGDLKSDLEAYKNRQK